MGAEKILTELNLKEYGKSTIIRFSVSNLSYKETASENDHQSSRYNFSIIIQKNTSEPFREIQSDIVLLPLMPKISEIKGQLATDGIRVWSCYGYSRNPYLGSLSEVKIDGPSNPILDSNLYINDEIIKLIAKGERVKYDTLHFDPPYPPSPYYESYGSTKIKYDNGRIVFSGNSGAYDLPHLDLYYDPDKREWGGPSVEMALKTRAAHEAQWKAAREAATKANEEGIKKINTTSESPIFKASTPPEKPFSSKLTPPTAPITSEPTSSFWGWICLVLTTGGGVLWFLMKKRA
jgi:hypothetical protein